MLLPASAVVMFPRHFRAVGGFSQAWATFCFCLAQLGALNVRKFWFCLMWVGFLLGHGCCKWPTVAGPPGALPRSPLPDCCVHLQAAPLPRKFSWVNRSYSTATYHLPRGSSWQWVSGPGGSECDSSCFWAPRTRTPSPQETPSLAPPCLTHLCCPWGHSHNKLREPEPASEESHLRQDKSEGTKMEPCWGKRHSCPGVSDNLMKSSRYSALIYAVIHPQDLYG